MDHAVALKNLDPSIVHRNRDGCDMHTRRCYQIFVESGIQLEDLGSDVKSLHHRLERIIMVSYGSRFSVDRLLVDVTFKRHWEARIDVPKRVGKSTCIRLTAHTFYGSNVQFARSP